MTNQQPISDILLPYQREFFMAPQKRKVWVSSRQIGKSFTIAALLTFQALKKPGNLSLCISVNSRSAAEIVKKCQMFAHAVQELTHGQVTHTASFDGIKFSNGSRVLSLPSTADSLRGFTAACVAIDEAAYVEHLDDVMQAISPTLSRDPEAVLILASTPAGKASTFYKTWEHAQADPAWHAQATTIEDAIQAGLKADLGSLHTLCPDQEAFAQEYMCTFSESCGTILDTSLLEAYDILPNGTHGSWLGADVGRKHDKTALVTGTERDGVLYVTGAKVLSGMQYRDQVQEIKKLNSQLHFTAGFIDAGGIGSMLAEVTQQEVSSRLKPFTFTGTSKAPLYEALRDLVFRQKVRFSPAIIQQVKDDMSGVTRAVSASGEVRYSAAHTSEGHSDLISALVLLIHAWKTHPMQASAPISFSRTSLLGNFQRRI